MQGLRDLTAQPEFLQPQAARTPVDEDMAADPADDTPLPSRKAAVSAVISDRAPAIDSQQI